MNNCPWCGAPAINISVQSRGFDQRAVWLCTGPDQHEFREGDGPVPEPEPAEPCGIVSKIKRLFS